jgi:hypothetical protein
MKTLTLILASIFTFFVSFSFAQEKAYLVLEENNGQYDVFLKIDNAKKLTSVSIEGYYSTQTKIDDVSINITNNKDLDKFKDNVAFIHSLDADAVAATYQVKIVDKDGVETSMPAVVVNLNDYDNFASNF